MDKVNIVADKTTFNIAYGGVTPAIFQNPQSLTKFWMPKIDDDDGLAPTTHTIFFPDIPHYNQGANPVCTAVASTTLVTQMNLLFKIVPFLPSVAFTFLAGEEIVYANDNIALETQLSSGLPLAASIDSVCKYGVVPSEAVPYADDPNKLRSWLASKKMSLRDLSNEKGVLPGPTRAIKLFPTGENIKACLLGGKAVAFAFRINPILDEWMRSKDLQRGSSFRIPPLMNMGPRLATHACVIVGFDDINNVFRVRNSFGSDWGDGGDFWIPYQTMLNTSFSAGEFYAFGAAQNKHA